MNLHPIDYLVVGGYFAAMIAIGLRFSRRNRSTERYFLSARNFPGWAIGLSFLGSTISSVTFIAYPADSFKTAWVRLLPNLAFPLVVTLAGLLFIPFFRGGVARSYYVGLETSAPAVPGVAPAVKALCVVPMGMEEGTQADVPAADLGLVVGEPAVFRFLSSTTRRDDPIGAVVERWNSEEIQELAPLETALPVEGDAEGATVPVRLHSHVDEVGTLQLSCLSTRDDRRWKLEFNVREPGED